MKTFYWIACFFLQSLASATGAEGSNGTQRVVSLRKCCSLGYSLFPSENGGKATCRESNLPFSPKYHTAKGLQPFTHFQLLIGRPCEPSFILGPNEYILFSNGLLYDEGSDFNYTSDKYCLESFADDGTTEILSLVCFANSSPIQLAHLSYPSGCLVSVIFLILTLAVYLMTELTNMHGKILSSFIICLIMVSLSLSVIQMMEKWINLSETFCKTAAFLVQFSFIGSYSWLNILCFHTWRKMRFDTLQRRTIKGNCPRFFMYCLYGWGLSLVVLIISITFDLDPTVPPIYLKPSYGLDGCWFQNNETTLSYFYSIISIVLIINFSFFILSIDYFPIETNRRNRFCDAVMILLANRRKERYYQNLSLAVTAMFSWVLQVISWRLNSDSWIWKIVDAFTSLQGLIVFILFIVLDSKARRLILKHCSSPRSQQTTSWSEENLADGDVLLEIYVNKPTSNIRL